MNTTRRTRTVVVAAMLLSAPLLSSCGVNFGAPTDQIYTPAQGVNDRSGAVDVINTLVVSESSGSGTVVAALINNNEQDADTLVTVKGGNGVTTPGPIDIPAGGAVQLADKGDVAISGDQIVPGKFVKITFEFQNAETITVNAPVYANTGDFADIPMPSTSPSTPAA